MNTHLGQRREDRLIAKAMWLEGCKCSFCTQRLDSILVPSFTHCWHCAFSSGKWVALVGKLNELCAECLREGATGMVVLGASQPGVVPRSRGPVVGSARPWVEQASLPIT